MRIEDYAVVTIEEEENENEAEKQVEEVKKPLQAQRPNG